MPEDQILNSDVICRQPVEKYVFPDEFFQDETNVISYALLEKALKSKNIRGFKISVVIALNCVFKKIIRDKTENIRLLDGDITVNINELVAIEEGSTFSNTLRSYVRTMSNTQISIHAYYGALIACLVICKNFNENNIVQVITKRAQAMFSGSDVVADVSDTSFNVEEFDQNQLLICISTLRNNLISNYSPLLKYFLTCKVDEENQILCDLQRSYRMVSKFTRLTRIKEIERCLLIPAIMKGFRGSAFGKELTKLQSDINTLRAERGDDFEFIRVFHRTAATKLDMANFPLLREVVRQLIDRNEDKGNFVKGTSQGSLLGLDKNIIAKIISKIVEIYENLDMSDNDEEN